MCQDEHSKPKPQGLRMTFTQLSFFREDFVGVRRLRKCEPMSNYIVEPDNRLEMAGRTANSEVINVKECDAVRAGIFNPITRLPESHVEAFAPFAAIA